MIDIPCVVFAGGKSSRMGEDKSLLPFGNFNTLTQYQLHRLKKIFKTVYISSKNSNKFDFDADFIDDIKTTDVFAPTAGFLSVFKHLPHQSFFALSVDTPFIDKKIIHKLIEADTSKADATIATLNGKMQPMCGIYHRSLEERFRDMLKTNNHKLGYLLKSVDKTFVDFFDEKAFLNLNKNAQYKKALTLLL